jgi:glycosyltransferase involved in cell wall biosynthesis
MLIAVNARFLIKDKLEGIGWYTYETMNRLVQRYPQHQFLFLFDREPDPSFIFGPNVTPLKVFPPARHPWLWYAWFEWALPRIFRKHQPDLFISPDGFLSLHTKVPTLLVIHDLGFEHYPEHTPPLVNKYYRKYTPQYAQKAEMIVTVSAFSRQDIINRYRVDPQKVRTIYNGANALYQPMDAAINESTRQRFTGGTPYFIYVGSIHPRKNVRMLLQAFDALKKSANHNIKLIIAGRMAWSTDDTQAVYEAMTHRDDVIFTGHLLQNELASLMAAAEAFVYPSLFEGFGIPVVEARYCGIPVITSNSSSLPEVAGAHALYVDPNDTAGMTKAMQLYLENPEHYKSLFSDTEAVREQFNWDHAVQQLENVLEEMKPGFKNQHTS